MKDELIQIDFDMHSLGKSSPPPNLPISRDFSSLAYYCDNHGFLYEKKYQFFGPVMGK